MPRTIELTELERRKMAEAGRQSIPCTNGWRPIETAPDDEVLLIVIRVYYSDGSSKRFVTHGTKCLTHPHDDEPNMFWVNGDTFEATHWQPLPKPPQEEI